MKITDRLSSQQLHELSCSLAVLSQWQKWYEFALEHFDQLPAAIVLKLETEVFESYIIGLAAYDMHGGMVHPAKKILEGNEFNDIFEEYRFLLDEYVDAEDWPGYLLLDQNDSVIVIDFTKMPKNVSPLVRQLALVDELCTVVNPDECAWSNPEEWMIAGDYPHVYVGEMAARGDFEDGTTGTLEQQGYKLVGI